MQGTNIQIGYNQPKRVKLVCLKTQLAVIRSQHGSCHKFKNIIWTIHFVRRHQKKKKIWEKISWSKCNPESESYLYRAIIDVRKLKPENTFHLMGFRYLIQICIS